MKINYKNFLLILLAIFCAAALVKAQQQEGVYQKQGIGRGSKISIKNDYGDITIRGWDANSVEAIATSITTAKTFPVLIQEDAVQDLSVAVKPEPDTRSRDKINLEIKIPRYMRLEPIYNSASDISVFDIDGIANLKTDGGYIKVSRIGQLEAHTANGNISAKGVRGSINLETGNGNIVVEDSGDKLSNQSGKAAAASLINITTGNGNIDIRNVVTDVRVVAINGKINLACVKGDVSIRDASSQINLFNVGGDVEVSTSNGRATFIGAIRPSGRYRLKTLSGVVSMAIPGDTGFSLLITSYKGRIETDFKSQGDPAAAARKTNQLVVGRFGDASARIELDSFDGRVELSKIASEAIRKCEVKTNDK